MELPSHIETSVSLDAFIPGIGHHGHAGNLPELPYDDAPHLYL